VQLQLTQLGVNEVRGWVLGAKGLQQQQQQQLDELKSVCCDLLLQPSRLGRNVGTQCSDSQLVSLSAMQPPPHCLTENT
jgi:hypothetical protein